jgi:hypothetical protein
MAGQSQTRIQIHWLFLTRYLHQASCVCGRRAFSKQKDPSINARVNPIDAKDPSAFIASVPVIAEGKGARQSIQTRCASQPTSVTTACSQVKSRVVACEDLIPPHLLMPMCLFDGARRAKNRHTHLMLLKVRCRRASGQERFDVRQICAGRHPVQ